MRARFLEMTEQLQEPIVTSDLRRRCLATTVRCLVVALVLSTLTNHVADAESPAPSVHWGALAFPDRERTIMAGMTFNRFTEFDGEGRRFNGINETIGFNMATVTWTERWTWLSGFNTNLTVGISPTADEPTQFLQNEVVHEIRGLSRVPVESTQESTDFTIDASVTKWAELGSQREIGFLGTGFSTGSVYHEVFGRLGVRRLSISEVLEAWTGSAPTFLKFGSRFARFSVMGRYSRVFGGAVFGQADIAPESYLGQASISLSDYDTTDHPDWELEIGATIDSGIFLDLRGSSLEERFGTIAIRTPYITFESWNDLINKKDHGPTFGASLMLDLIKIGQGLDKLFH